MQLRPITAIAVLLLVVASLLVSGCTTSKNEQTVQANSTNTPSQNSPTVSVTATSLGSANSVTTNHGAVISSLNGNKFVKYAVYFENIKAKGVDADMGNPNSLKLRDTKSNLYSFDTNTFGIADQQVNGKTLKGLTVQIGTRPGDKYSGIVVFQIPTNATPKSLTYDDYVNKITINL